MKLAFFSGTAAAVLLLASASASAGVEFGAPDFPNYLSRIGAVSCDWQYESYFRACPEPQIPPKPIEPPGKTRAKSATKSK